jgi:hypothetical protein
MVQPVTLASRAAEIRTNNNFSFMGVSVVVVMAVMMVVAVMVIRTHINANWWPDADIGAGYGTSRE